MAIFNKKYSSLETEYPFLLNDIPIQTRWLLKNKYLYTNVDISLLRLQIESRQTWE
jgi:hypothetical protein